VLLGIVGAVLPIELEGAKRARSLLSTPSLQARDAIHIAVMQRHGIDRALTFDRVFDEFPGLTRLQLSFDRAAPAGLRGS
jgi:predicted nucleic acid-binding protein